MNYKTEDSNSIRKNTFLIDSDDELELDVDTFFDDSLDNEEKYIIF